MQAKHALTTSTWFVSNACAVALALSGCSAFHEPASEAQRPERDAAALAASDGGDPSPASSNDGGGEIVLTVAQARCLELDQASCAACHSRGGVLVLRPVGVPPPPPGTTVPVEQCLPVPPASELDGGNGAAGEASPVPNPPFDPVAEQVLSDEQAACIGLNQPICSVCHVRQGRFALRPRGAPPHPEGGNELLDRCL
jgi:hypothetical protein